MPIDAAAKDLLLRMQYRSMTATYRHEYPNARREVVELVGEPVGCSSPMWESAASSTSISRSARERRAADWRPG